MKLNMETIKRYYDVELHAHLNLKMRQVVDEERAVKLVDHHVAAPIDITGLPQSDPSKKTICFYYHHINNIGGVEIAMMNLMETLQGDYNIVLAFSADSSSPHMLCRLAQYANRVVNLYHSDYRIRCDLLVVCSIYCALCRRIDYKYAFRWVHGSVKEMGLHSINDIQINGKTPDKSICVSEESARQYEEVFKLPVMTIHNIVDYAGLKELSEAIPDDFDHSVLNLVTVSRISREKGMERMLKMAGMLTDAGIAYKWRIIGSGFDKPYEVSIKTEFEEYPEVEFLGALDNPFPYMAQSDYLVLLSDYESYALVVMEALSLKTPCVITNFKVAEEILGDNGYIVEKDLSDLDVNQLLKKPEVHADRIDDLHMWYELFSEIGLDTVDCL